MKPELLRIVRAAQKAVVGDMSAGDLVAELQSAQREGVERVLGELAAAGRLSSTVHGKVRGLYWCSETYVGATRPRGVRSWLRELLGEIRRDDRDVLEAARELLQVVSTEGVLPAPSALSSGIGERNPPIPPEGPTPFG